VSTVLQETEVSCNDGRFIINERLVRRIIESYYRAKANIQFGKVKEMDTSPLPSFTRRGWCRCQR
jgi:hypothetical protein